MRRAWLALTFALAVHVADEAWNDFLGFYNPFIMMLRDVLLWQWLPTFEFGEWLGGLIVAILVLFALSHWSGRRWLAWTAIPYGLLLTGNALLHIGGSIYTQRMLPGTLSAPLLAACGVWLITSAIARLRS
ncbi:MAG TPA: hypothetical protein VGK29_16860 [Paludibaculum sp.]|jgi:hypothetical protein